MKIDLRELREGANRFEWEEAPGDLSIQAEEVSFVGPLRTRLEVYKVGQSLSASGETAFRLHLECVRCLEPFDLDLSCRYQFILQKGHPASPDDAGDDTVVWVDEESGTVDLGGEVKDYVLLEIPLKPLCDESCAGLCPVCGTNLNSGRCACRQEKVDPRWEALRALKGK